MKSPIYLDYQATTPLGPEAVEAMRPWMEEKFWNPHSPHVGGRMAAATVEASRSKIAALFPDDGQFVFTSGATEALNLAIRGVLPAPDAQRNRIVLPDTEHAAVRDTAMWLGRKGYDIAFIPVRSDGLVDLAVMSEAIDGRTALVCTMLVNNEIGVIQPVAQIAELSHKADALFLCDAVQGYGRVPLPVEADMIAISSHKIHGPKGIGGLWIRSGVEVEPLIHGGGQEKGLRSGTLSPALCAGFGAAADLMRRRAPDDAEHVDALWMRGTELFADWTVNGSIVQRYRGNLNIRLPGLDADRLISEVRGVALAAGSACASGSGRASHVLSAIGLDERDARSSLRLGFGRYTTMAELEQAAQWINEAARSQGTD